MLSNIQKKIINKIPALDEDDKVLAKSSVGTFAVKIVGLIITFLLQLFLANIMNATQFGIYSLVWAWVYFLTLFSLIGFNTTFIKFISKYRVENKVEKIKGLLRSGNVIAFINSLLILGTGFLVFNYVDLGLGSEYIDPFLIGFICVVMLVLVRLNQGALQGFKKVVLSKIPEAVGFPLLLIISISAWYYGVKKVIQAETVLIFALFSLIIIYLLGFYWRGKATDSFSEYDSISAEYDLKEWIQVSLPLLFVSAMYFLVKKTDILMVGFYLEPDYVGYYSVASSISGVVTFGLVAVNSIMAPLISEKASENDIIGLQKIVSNSIKGLLFYGVPITIIFIIFGSFFLGLFGDAFRVAYWPLILLVAGQLINLMFGPAGLLMTMTEYQKESFYILISSTAVNVLLNIILIPIMGLIGAACATMISIILNNFLMYLFVKIKTGIKSFVV